MKAFVSTVVLWMVTAGAAFGGEQNTSIHKSLDHPEQTQTSLPMELGQAATPAPAGTGSVAATPVSAPAKAASAAPQAASRVTGPEATGDTPVVSFLLKTTLLGSEWVLWLLLALSVVSGAVILDRILYFRRNKIDFTRFITELSRSLNNDDLDAVSNLCRAFHRSLESEIVAVALANRDKGASAIEKSMTGYLAWQKHKLDKGLTFLGTLGNNAPFIGLFGTVLGIIQAFHQLALNPTGGSTVVMSGISSALVATAVGLFVAIPAVLAFNSFQRVVKQKLSNADAVQDLMMMHFAAESARKSGGGSHEKNVG